MLKGQRQAILLFSFLCMLNIFAYNINKVDAKEIDPNSTTESSEAITSEEVDGSSSATTDNNAEPTGQPMKVPETVPETVLETVPETKPEQTQPEVVMQT